MIELRFNSNPKNPEEWIKLFIHACSNGDLDLVRMLFEPEFKSISNLHYGDEEGFRIARGNGHLDIVKFLTTSSELLASAHSFVDIHAQDEEGFQLACRYGHLDVIQFLTTSSELLAAGHTFVNIHSNCEEGLNWACQEGHLEVLKFLTTSPVLLHAGHTFADIHGYEEEGFQLACDASHWNIVKFLIFDLNIEKTKTIVKIIQKYPQTESYFEAREERKKLSECIKSIPSLQNSIDYDSQDLNSNLTSIRI